MRTHLITTLLAITAASGCARKVKLAPDPCGADHASLVEVRDGEGKLQLALLSESTGSTRGTVCDAAGRKVGTLAPRNQGLALQLNRGGMVASSSTAPGEDAMLQEDAGNCTASSEVIDHLPRCRAYRLHESGNLLRLLDRQGVPLGQLARESERAIAYDPGGRGIATAERVEKQDDSRHAIRAPDGKVLHIVLGLHDDRAVAALALPSLSMEEKLLLARFLDTR